MRTTVAMETSRAVYATRGTISSVARDFCFGLVGACADDECPKVVTRRTHNVAFGCTRTDGIANSRRGKELTW